MPSVDSLFLRLPAFPGPPSFSGRAASCGFRYLAFVGTSRLPCVMLAPQFDGTCLGFGACPPSNWLHTLHLLKDVCSGAPALWSCYPCFGFVSRRGCSAVASASQRTSFHAVWEAPDFVLPFCLPLCGLFFVRWRCVGCGLACTSCLVCAFRHVSHRCGRSCLASSCAAVGVAAHLLHNCGSGA